MKKPILFLFVVYFIFFTVHAIEIPDENAKETISNLKIADLSWFENEEYITRYDCIALILRAIGVDAIIHPPYGGAGPLFSDGADDPIRWVENYIDKCKFFSSGIDYLGMAREFTDIIYGEYICENDAETVPDQKPVIYFNYTRPVTAKEAVAFMVRCLSQPTEAFGDLNFTFQRGIEIGLVKESDSFYKNPDEPISCDDFFVVLHRFLYQPKYLYFDDTDGRAFLVNTTENDTYYDYLTGPGKLDDELTRVTLPVESESKVQQ